MNKKILSGALAAMMLVSPTYAIEAAGGTGDVPVHLTQDATQFSVTVPTVLPVDISATGVVTVANENKIINNSFGPVEVKSVSVESLGDWKLVDFDTDFKSKKVGLHEYGFQMNQADVQPDGSCAAVFEVIPGNRQISFVYDSKVATQNTALSKENIANVVFTIGWSGQLNATHKLSKSKMDTALKNLTGKITFATTTYQGEGGIDISEAGDGSVIAVVSGQDATVYSEGGVLGINTVDYNVDTGMFSHYNIKEIDLHGLDMSKMANANYMFKECRSLTALDLSGADMSNLTDTWGMFELCSKLTILDLSGMDLSNVRKAGSMFRSCYSLTSLNLSGVNMNSVTEASDMFGNNPSLVTIDLSELNMNNVTNVASMFSDCKSLTTLDISSVNMSQVTSVNVMFRNCTALTTIDLSGINMSQATMTNGMFLNCTALKTCYAKTQQDCDKLNNSSEKPSNVNFVVKPI